MDDSPNAPQISGDALRWRDNTPLLTQFLIKNYELFWLLGRKFGSSTDANDLRPLGGR